MAIWRSVSAIRSAFLLAALVAIGGLTLSLGTTGILDAAERDAAHDQFDRRSALLRDAVAGETGRYVDTLRTVAAATGAFERLTAAKFAQAAAPLAQMQLAGATSIVFVAPATDEQVPDVQEYWRAASGSSSMLTLHPEKTAGDHQFVIFSELLEAKSQPQLGLDVTQAAAPSQALTEARRSGNVTVSDTYQLLLDRDLPEQQRQMSFVLTAPVYNTPVAGGPRQFRGWVLMGLRGQSFIGATLDRLSQDLLDVTLKAQNANHSEVTVASLHAKRTGKRDLTRDVEVAVADRTWRLQVQATGHALPGAASGMPTAIAVGGGLLSLLLAALVFMLATDRARARAQVHEATAGLLAARDELAAREQYLSDVLDAVEAVVVTTDTEGRFVHRNLAAKALGKPAGTDNRADDSAAKMHIVGADGEPMSRESQPTPRALAGETVHGCEIIIEPLNGGPRRTLLAHAAPLRDKRGAIIGAVSSAYDITARKHAELQLAEATAELRAELVKRQETEAELQAFAGVVAHDLKSPLTAVTGYAEMLRDDLRSAGADASPCVAANRILHGAQRMRVLIDDLLAYATARDGTLSRETVDLQSLVAEIVTERTGHLRNGQGNEAPPLFPDIYIGPLPTITADLGMIRQLLDNLIGNALKYTVPGQPARIAISASSGTDDGQILVEIADRGIGIPPGQHDQVFNSFHRVNTGKEYSGTGLGLAICQRIIDRHDGSIRVTDNPGGGSRFQFTLPVTDGHPQDPLVAEAPHATSGTAAWHRSTTR